MSDADTDGSENGSGMDIEEGMDSYRYTDDDMSSGISDYDMRGINYYGFLLLQTIKNIQGTLFY